MTWDEVKRLQKRLQKQGYGTAILGDSWVQGKGPTYKLEVWK